MDKVFSARLGVEVVEELERACRLLRVTKKDFLEEAVQCRVRQLAPEAVPGGPGNIWEKTCGAWKRKEAPPATIARIRKTMEDDFHRHHRRKNAKLSR